MKIILLERTETVNKSKCTPLINPRKLAKTHQPVKINQDSYLEILLFFNRNRKFSVPTLLISFFIVKIFVGLIS